MQRNVQGDSLQHSLVLQIAVGTLTHQLGDCLDCIRLYSIRLYDVRLDSMQFYSNARLFHGENILTTTWVLGKPRLLLHEDIIQLKVSAYFSMQHVDRIRSSLLVAYNNT